MSIPDDQYEISLQEITGEKIRERLDTLILILHRFRETFGKINQQEILFENSVEEVASRINNDYWDFVIFLKEEKYIVDKTDNKTPRINIYKIISATEFSIIKNQPVTGERRRLLNACCAFYVATFFYNKWFEKDLATISFKNNDLYRVWDKFYEDRIAWLSSLELNTSFPFFLNSQVWMLIDVITKDAAGQT